MIRGSSGVISTKSSGAELEGPLFYHSSSEYERLEEFASRIARVRCCPHWLRGYETVIGFPKLTIGYYIFSYR